MPSRTLEVAVRALLALLLLMGHMIESRPQFWLNYAVGDWNRHRLLLPAPYYAAPSRFGHRESHGPSPGHDRRPAAGPAPEGKETADPPTRPHAHVSKILASPKPGPQNVATNTDFVFPGESSKPNAASIPDVMARFDKAVPKCSKGATFCEEEDGYPSELIESILRNSAQDFEGLFGEDFLPINVSQRIDGFDETPACPSKEEIVFPTMAENGKNQWAFIVNIKDKFEQGVRVEQCMKDGDACKMNAVPFGYSTSCKQKYIYRKLVGVDRQGAVASDDFKLPSCCACYIKPEPMGISFGAPRSRSTPRK